ncbi:hypothetical protein Emed_003180 [Eimeria media]
MATFVEGEDGQYAVEDILAIRRVYQRFYLLVKWEGYDSDDNTWEPMSSFGVSPNFAFREKIEALKRRYWGSGQAEATAEKAKKSPKTTAAAAEAAAAAEEETAAKTAAEERGRRQMSPQVIAEEGGRTWLALLGEGCMSEANELLVGSKIPAV